MRPAGWGSIVFVLVLAADQASKWFVRDTLHLEDVGSIALLPWLNFTFVWNTGITFGLLHFLGAAGAAVLSVASVAVAAGLLWWMRRAAHFAQAAALGAIAGGAVGNVVDRVRFGAVVDFIHAHAFGFSWYVFNVADASIVCGVAALLLVGVPGARPGGLNAGARDATPSR